MPGVDQIYNDTGTSDDHAFCSDTISAAAAKALAQAAAEAAATDAADAHQSKLAAYGYQDQARIYKDQASNYKDQALAAVTTVIQDMGLVIGVNIQAYDPNIVSDAFYVHTDNNFTTLLKANYDAAYGWGDHSAAGYAAAAHTHSGVYEPADATILKSAAIGVSIQAYDINTVKYNTPGRFTAIQREARVAGSNAINFTAGTHFEFTATAANITVGTMAAAKEQEGTFTIHSAELVTGWGAEFRFAPNFSAVTPTPPASMSGTMKFWYEIIEVNGVDGGTANIIYVAWAQ